MIKGFEFVLDYVASLGDSDSYSDSDSKSSFSSFDFSDTKRSGLKTLTPNQILSRLPIYLAQLKAGNNSEKLKNEIRQLKAIICILCTDQKKLQKMFIKVCLTLFKTWKQSL